MPSSESTKKAMKIAIEAGDLETVKAFINTSKIDVNADKVLEDTMPSLSFAISVRNSTEDQTKKNKLKEIIKFLIEKGADVNGKDDEENTPLHYAVLEEGGIDKEIVQLLLDKGADVNASNSDGDTPLHLVVSYPESSEITKLLIEKGADVNMINADGNTPVHIVVSYPESSEITKLLIENGADLNAIDPDGRTPLFNALSVENNQENVKLLLQNGADVNIENMEETPLFATIKSYIVGSIEYVKLLVEIGKADVDKGDSAEGKTPLMAAVINNNIEIASYLLEKGAKKDLKDKSGKTAYEYAKSDEMKELLSSETTPQELYKGYSKSDVEMFNTMFEKPNDWSYCPVCLAFVQRSDGCMYMRHICKQNDRHEKLFQKLRDIRYKPEGEIEWCTICGRITNGGHIHYKLYQAKELFSGKKPELVPTPATQPNQHFENDCVKVGGGGFPEKVRRTHRLLAYACELQEEVGKLSKKEARNELIEEVFNAGDLRNRKIPKMIENKKFEFPCIFPEDEKPVEEGEKPDIPRPADEKELTPVKHEGGVCVLNQDGNDDGEFVGVPHEDGRPVYQFRHKQPNGTIYNHVDYICAEDLKALIDNNTIDGKCRIEPDKCQALLYPEELKGIVDDEFYEKYRKLFNKANAVATGGGEDSLMKPVDMSTASCAPPQSIKQAGKRNRSYKQRRVTRKHITATYKKKRGGEKKTRQTRRRRRV